MSRCDRVQLQYWQRASLRDRFQEVALMSVLHRFCLAACPRPRYQSVEMVEDRARRVLTSNAFFNKFSA
eukprot:477688-Alexandrium_andersonii.AAC.1